MNCKDLCAISNKMRILSRIKKRKTLKSIRVAFMALGESDSPSTQRSINQ